MFLNISRISASNVLRKFLNITVNIGCTFVVFYSHKPTGSINLAAIPCSATKKYIISRKYLKTNLHMYNTIGDVALTNIGRKINCLHDFVQYQK